MTRGLVGALAALALAGCATGGWVKVSDGIVPCWEYRDPNNREAFWTGTTFGGCIASPLIGEYQWPTPAK